VSCPAAAAPTHPHIHSALRTEAGDIIQTVEVLAGSSTADMEGGCLRNNYSRPEGQNMGNYMTDRPSSRVLAAPGGASSIVFGDEGSPYAPAARTGRGRAPGALANAEHQTTNNYSRPEGQNVGNYITGRNVSGCGGWRRRCSTCVWRCAGRVIQRCPLAHPAAACAAPTCAACLQSTKVHAPPGGASQIHFG
jgi:SPIRAL1-like protein